jgi:hypothetical protein
MTMTPKPRTTEAKPAIVLAALWRQKDPPETTRRINGLDA